MKPRRVLLGFIAGFLAVLIFHQGLIAIFYHTGVTERTPYVSDPTKPFGVPQFLSAAFWGGIWGIIFSFLLPADRKSIRYWLTAIVGGALLPTLVAWFVVMPLKGMPMAGGGDREQMIGGLLVNAAFGLGVGLFLAWFDRGSRRQLPAA